MPGDDELQLDLESLSASTRVKLDELARKAGISVKDYVASVLSHHIAAEWVPTTTRRKNRNDSAPQE